MSLKLILFFWLAQALAGQDSATSVADNPILAFAPLDYPLGAKLKQEEGVVVLAVKSDSKGSVVDARTLFGKQSLAASCIENAKKWRLKGGISTILVYWFRVEGLCQLPCASQFIFYPPNISVIRTGVPTIDHSADR